MPGFGFGAAHRHCHPHPTPTPSYTSPARYSFAGTNFRWPVASQSNATNMFMAVEWYSATPDYAITDPRVFVPSFWSPTPTPNEVYLAAGASITVQGWAIEFPAGSGTWIACDGAAEAGVATITNAGPGALLPRVPVTLAPNTIYRMRMTWVVSATGVAIPRNTAAAGANAPAGQMKMEGSTTTRFARLSATGANFSNSGGVTMAPAFMVAKGGDGRPAILAFGDSIGYGANDSGADSVWSARNAFGYIERGLDDNAGAKRLAYHISCIPGQRAAGPDGWDVAGNWAGRRGAYQAVYDLQGAWPFDFILSQHITNSVPYSNDGGDLRVGFGRYYDLLASSYGKPVTQIEGLPSTSSSDGYATVANQTGASGKAYPSSGNGDLWGFNALVGVDGVPDAGAYFRSGGKIEDSIGVWRNAAASADTGANRGKWAVGGVATTLAASAAANATSISTVAAPLVGASLVVALDAGGFGNARIVTAVAGSGPYTVTLNGGIGTAAAAGNAVRTIPADGAGLHPSGVTHKALAAEVVAWKARRGWV